MPGPCTPVSTRSTMSASVSATRREHLSPAVTRRHEPSFVQRFFSPDSQTTQCRSTDFGMTEPVARLSIELRAGGAASTCRSARRSWPGTISVTVDTLQLHEARGLRPTRQRVFPHGSGRYPSWRNEAGLCYGLPMAGRTAEQFRHLELVQANVARMHEAATSMNYLNWSFSETHLCRGAAMLVLRVAIWLWRNW